MHYTQQRREYEPGYGLSNLQAKLCEELERLVYFEVQERYDKLEKMSHEVENIGTIDKDLPKARISLLTAPNKPTCFRIQLPVCRLQYLLLAP